MALRSSRGNRRGQGLDPGRPHEGQGFCKCLNPVAWVRAMHCNSVYITRYRSMKVPVSIRASYNMANIRALVDSGATDNFIHPNFVKRMGLGKRELDKPKNIYNINDTTNKAGQITHYLTLAITTGGTM
jgi:hypothetical protein